MTIKFQQAIHQSRPAKPSRQEGNSVNPRKNKNRQHEYSERSQGQEADCGSKQSAEYGCKIGEQRKARPTLPRLYDYQKAGRPNSNNKSLGPSNLDNSLEDQVARE